MRHTLFERFAWIRDKARGCAVSPDARWVAVTHDDRLAVYERATQREACAWRRGGRQVRAWWCDADEGEFLALVDLHRGDVDVAPWEVVDDGSGAAWLAPSRVLLWRAASSLLLRLDEGPVGDDRLAATRPDRGGPPLQALGHDDLTGPLQLLVVDLALLPSPTCPWRL